MVYSFKIHIKPLLVKAHKQTGMHKLLVDGGMETTQTEYVKKWNETNLNFS